MPAAYAKNDRELAKRYKVSLRAIAKWRVRGLPKRGRNGLSLADCDAWVEQNRKPRDKTATIADLDRQKKEETVRQLKRDNEVAEGKLIDKATVEREIEQMCARAKTVLLRIPTTIGSKLGNDAEQISRAIVQESLRELEERPV